MCHNYFSGLYREYRTSASALIKYKVIRRKEGITWDVVYAMHHNEDDVNISSKHGRQKVCARQRQSLRISRNTVTVTVALCTCRAENEQVRALKATARRQVDKLAIRKDEGRNVRQELAASCHRSKLSVTRRLSDATAYLFIHRLHKHAYVYGK